jgi:hypothetical protein
MSDVYLSLADGFEKLAAGYRALAKQGDNTPPPAEPEARQVTIEEVRAVLGKKSEEGKTREIKALLMKYDAGKLSGVKPEDYPALIKEAEAL